MRKTTEYTNERMDGHVLIPHLFRTEYRKIVAVLCKYFGLERIEWAEDIASDTFLEATQRWTFNGVPPNPQAWLYAVAKNKAKNALTRAATFQEKIAPALVTAANEKTAPEPDLSATHIRDSQLQMMFVLSNPCIPPESQVGLALRILCGFGTDEIARAFLAKKETIEKRLYRAKDRLREEGIRPEWPTPHDVEKRLSSVLTMLYLLFNEGYYSQSEETILREELCFDAIYLLRLLLEYPPAATPATKALLALMYFHASRFKARRPPGQPHVMYDQQDAAKWDQSLIAAGVQLLHEASGGDQLSAYHLEAAIAWSQTRRNLSTEEWEQLVTLYDLLLLQKDSPMARIDRLYALSKCKDREAVIEEALELQLFENPFYLALLGELYTGVDDVAAIKSFEAAILTAGTATDRQALKLKRDRLFSKIHSNQQ